MKKSRDVDGFNLKLALQHLNEAKDILVETALGYKPSERNNLCDTIARLSLIEKNTEKWVS